MACNCLNRWNGLVFSLRRGASVNFENTAKEFNSIIGVLADDSTLKVLGDLYAKAAQYYTENPQEIAKFLAEPKGPAKHDGRQRAALTVVANAIMNLDEFVMKE